MTQLEYMLFDTKYVTIGQKMAQTIVTYRASGFPAKFGIRMLAGFELFDGIKAASSLLGVRFALLATLLPQIWHHKFCYA